MYDIVCKKCCWPLPSIYTVGELLAIGGVLVTNERGSCVNKIVAKTLIRVHLTMHLQGRVQKMELGGGGRGGGAT